MLERYRSLLDLVGDHCDLERRLADLPTWASYRGWYFGHIQNLMAASGHAEAYAMLVGSKRYAPMRYYPLPELLCAVTAAGALLAGPEQVHVGAEQVTRASARVYSDTLIGRVVTRLLSTDPRRLLQQGLAARRLSANYGRWYLSFPGPRSAEMRFETEYMPIDSMLVGAARGTFDAIGMECEIEVEVDGPYDGVHRLRW